jgi:hypothetical protein
VARIAEGLVLLVVAYELRRNGDWLTGAGWATLALVTSLAWLMPWYVIWALPLAALSRSVKLRRAVVALSIFVLITFVPATTMFLSAHGLNPPISPAGQRLLAGQSSGR